MSRRIIVSVVAVVALVATAVPGAADEEEEGFRALTINTPGQRGHVSAADYALMSAGGDAPPHMTDQLDPYAGFLYRSGAFQPDSGIPDMVLPGARIYRDDYGVPAIYADTLVNAWRAAGYAISEDRMWQQHLLRMVAQGRLAEMLGTDGLEMDIQQRRDYYTAAEYKAFFAALEPWEQDVLEAYAQGVNLYIAEMHANPAKMPVEIAALGLPIEPWDAIDSLALGALMARSVASDGGQELENAKLLRDLVAAHGEVDGKAIFNDLLWLNDPGAPASVPAEEGTFSSYPDGPPQADSLDNSVQETLELPAYFKSVARQLRVERKLRAKLQDELGLPNPGSNAWAVAPERSADDSAFLFNGPQVGYTMPGLLTEFEIHIAEEPFEMDAKGVTVAGVPVVGIGYTDHHAWGLTSGLSDTKDLYIEELVGDDRHYRYKGEVLEMDCRTETFVVKSTLEIADGTPPTIEEREFCRTVHGPVIAVDEEAGVAYSQRYAIWNEEIGTLKGLMRFPLAESLEDFEAAIDMVTWNENATYADAEGNIAYWHPGLYPKRPRNFDERLPYPGTGEAEWEGLLTFEQMPHAINPEQGWLANWNSKPSVGWTSGDPHYGDRPWGQANRLDSLARVLAADDSVSPWGAPDDDGLTLGRDGIFAPDVSGGVYDQTIYYFRDFLARAAADPSATDRQRAALAEIAEWDGNLEDLNSDGRYDAPGATIFHEWVERAAKSVFGQYLTIGGFSRGGHPTEPSPVINLFLRSLLGDAATLPQSRDYLAGRTAEEVILTTLSDALARLETRFGTANLAEWLGNIRTSELEVQGLGPEDEIPYQDRGSWIEVLEYPVDDDDDGDPDDDDDDDDGDPDEDD